MEILILLLIAILILDVILRINEKYTIKIYRKREHRQVIRRVRVINNVNRTGNGMPVRNQFVRRPFGLWTKKKNLKTVCLFSVKVNKYKKKNRNFNSKRTL